MMCNGRHDILFYFVEKLAGAMIFLAAQVKLVLWIGFILMLHFLFYFLYK
jgi:hypothetical protein